MLPSMSMKRQNSTLCVFLGKIFVMGGYYNGNVHSSVECYDPTTNKWTSVAPMNNERSGAQAGVSDGDLYVVGGNCNDVFLPSIERYDRQTNIWTLVNSFE